ncbi:phosphoprotein phosphatase 2c [Malassezia pachydermatis]|uniref:Phosphoprotein phosphatase 2c n=1 Tax=Malassezia pachydermatis TaxID=77020 RepID=A0A0M8MMP1_9BASI|nr:phosphoprotein phosphatase 2c [Malassezia pachydermatis]KOS15576.1 phosphoprotein phosphatase 2c [Malassezia pachydermatis]
MQLRSTAPALEEASVTSIQPQKTESSHTSSTQNWDFKVGVATDRNNRWRKTMEDTHAYEYNFENVPGQGYFAVFDGHAGHFAADWCKDNMGSIFEKELKDNPDMDVREIMKNTFLKADKELEFESERAGTRSGCTAVMCFIRYEPASSENTNDRKRVLYTANVGDARAVLCRNGKAVRLTYDHKGSDMLESKRITDKGGFLLNNRVNGVLAVTRSLGDFSMKEFVVGSPFTTSIDLLDEDEFLVVACDGLWDVVNDQNAVELVSKVKDPQDAADTLLQHALDNFSTDNTSVMVARFCKADS